MIVLEKEVLLSAASNLTGINTVLIIDRENGGLKSAPDSRWEDDLESKVLVSKEFSCLFGIKNSKNDTFVVMIDKVRHVVTYRSH